MRGPVSTAGASIHIAELRAGASSRHVPATSSTKLGRETELLFRARMRWVAIACGSPDGPPRDSEADSTRMLVGATTEALRERTLLAFTSYPARRARVTAARGHLVCAPPSRGSTSRCTVTQNVLPRPGAVSSSMPPPSACAA